VIIISSSGLAKLTYLRERDREEREEMDIKGRTHILPY
jgi:hypothetical protein